MLRKLFTNPTWKVNYRRALLSPWKTIKESRRIEKEMWDELPSIVAYDLRSIRREIFVSIMWVFIIFLAIWIFFAEIIMGW